VFAQIAPDQPSVVGIPVHRVDDSSALMAPPTQVERCPPNRVNSTRRMPPFGVFPVGATAIGVSFFIGEWGGARSLFACVRHFLMTGVELAVV